MGFYDILLFVYYFCNKSDMILADDNLSYVDAY